MRHRLIKLWAEIDDRCTRGGAKGKDRGMSLDSTADMTLGMLSALMMKTIVSKVRTKKLSRAVKEKVNAGRSE